MRALRWLGILAAGLVSFVLVFWLTWPSDAVSNRIRHEVREASRGDLDLTLTSTAPQWIGLGGQDVIAYAYDAAGVREPFLAVDALWATVSPWSLFGRPEVQAGARLGEGSLDVDVTLDGLGRRARPEVVRVDGNALPVADLLALARGGGSQIPVVATGGLDLDASLVLGAAWTDLVGDLSIQGRDLVVVKVEIPTMGELTLDSPVDELEIALRFEDGTADVVEGTIRTLFADIEIDGEITLADRLGRSRLDLEVVVTLGDWSGSPLESFRTLLEKQMDVAKGDDDRYHYTLKGMLGRLDLSDLRPDRSARRVTTGRVDGPASTTSASDAAASRLERLRQRREARENTPVSKEAKELATRLPPAQRRAQAARRAEARRREAEAEAEEDEELDELGYAEDDEEGEDEEALEELDEDY